MRKNENPHPNLSVWEFPYHDKCKCGKEFTIYTQDDDRPEYYTDVWVVCECGGLTHFSLPVN